jgi:hypothetical protein
LLGGWALQNQCLIISNPTDLHTQVVARKLQDLGCEPILFYPHQLSTDIQVSVVNYPKLRVELIWNSGKRIDLLDANIVSVWFRRPNAIDFSSFDLNVTSKEFAIDEWQHLMSGLYDLLATKFWVSAPDALNRCARKVSQIVVAEQLGFRVPQTIFTSHMPDLVDKFQNWREQAIVKPIGRGWVLEGDQVKFIMTNELQWGHLKNPVSLNISPSTSQEYISKEYELRITVVGRKIYAAKIDSQKSEISRLDWRRYDMSNTPYTPYQLPEDIKLLCTKLLDYYGLNFGAIDMIKTPTGEYVFLEINGNGQFLWVEEATKIDISGEMARMLCNGKL